MWRQELVCARFLRLGDYTLAPSVRARGLKVLGLTEKDLLLDLFADAENAQRSLFCSKENSAFNYSYRKLNDESGGWLWANPPSYKWKHFLKR